jgi:hypothetical protein
MEKKCPYKESKTHEDILIQLENSRCPFLYKKENSRCPFLKKKEDSKCPFT